MASTASKNSMPRCSRRSSYQRPASRYSANASSSNRTRGFTSGAARLRRGGGHPPRESRPSRPSSPDGRGAQFPRPRRPRLPPDPRLRHRHDVVNGGVNGIEELDAQVFPALFVPSTGEAILGIRFVLESNGRIHFRRRSASARRRTSSQGIPAVSAVITRRARRSISAAQAASTSAGS